MPRVAIISTGNELIYGRTRDENSSFLSRMLFPTGLRVRMHLAVGDIVEDLVYAVMEAAEAAELTLLTGGLGPTADDHTLEALKRIYGFEEVIYGPGRERMEKYFRSMGRAAVDGDLKMVTVPGGAHVFDNDLGLAAGFALEKNGKMLIAMPGVPREMRHMFEHRVLPYLVQRYASGGKRFLEFRLVLVREAEADRQVQAMAIPFESVEYGITTTPGMNTLTFVGRDGMVFPEKEITGEIRRVFGDRLLEQGHADLESELLGRLSRKGLTISAAESCTGGLIAQRLTSVPGSSKAFLGGVVAYSNQAKISFLGVPADLIEARGAVSEETAVAMAEGARERFGSSLAVSVTGIAGPEGGSAQKPVGTVCFALAMREGTMSFTELIMGDRERIRTMSSQYALEAIRAHVKGGRWVSA